MFFSDEEISRENLTSGCMSCNKDFSIKKEIRGRTNTQIKAHRYPKFTLIQLEIHTHFDQCLFFGDYVSVK